MGLCINNISQTISSPTNTQSMQKVSFKAKKDVVDILTKSVVNNKGKLAVFLASIAGLFGLSKAKDSKSTLKLSKIHYLEISLDVLRGDEDYRIFGGKARIDKVLDALDKYSVNDKYSDFVREGLQFFEDNIDNENLYNADLPTAQLGLDSQGTKLYFTILTALDKALNLNSKCDTTKLEKDIAESKNFMANINKPIETFPNFNEIQ